MMAILNFYNSKFHPFLTFHSIGLETIIISPQASWQTIPSIIRLLKIYNTKIILYFILHLQSPTPSIKPPFITLNYHQNFTPKKFIKLNELSIHIFFPRKIIVNFDFLCSVNLVLFLPKFSRLFYCSILLLLFFLISISKCLWFWFNKNFCKNICRRWFFLIFLLFNSKTNTDTHTLIHNGKHT